MNTTRLAMDLFSKTGRCWLTAVLYCMTMALIVLPTACLADEQWTEYAPGPDMVVTYWTWLPGDIMPSGVSEATVCQNAGLDVWARLEYDIDYCRTCYRWEEEGQTHTQCDPEPPEWGWCGGPASWPYDYAWQGATGYEWYESYGSPYGWASVDTSVAGDKTVTVVVHDTATDGTADSSTEPFTWIIHVRPSGPPPLEDDTCEPPSGGCGGGSCGSCDGGGGSWGFPSVGIPSWSVPKPGFIGGGPIPGGSTGSSKGCRRCTYEISGYCDGYWIRMWDCAGKCSRQGPFGPGSSISFWLNGSRFSGSVSYSMGLTLTVTSPDGSSVYYGGVHSRDDGDSYITRPTWSADPSGNRIYSVYGSHGELQSVTTADGKQWTYEANDAAYPSQVTRAIAPDGTSSEIDFVESGPAAGKIAAETRRDSEENELSTMEYHYNYWDTGTSQWVDDPQGRLRRATSGDKTVTYDYSTDGDDTLTTIREVHLNGNGLPDKTYSETVYRYGPPVSGIATTTVTRKGLLAGEQDQTTTYTYYTSGDLKGQIHEVTDAYSKTTTYDYQVITMQAASGSNPAVTHARLTQITDPEGNLTKHKYVTYGVDDSAVPKLWVPPVESIERYDNASPRNLLSTESYTFYEDTTVSPAPAVPRWLRTVKDVRGTYTYYKRDRTLDGGVYTNHPERVLAIKVSASQHSDNDWENNVGDIKTIKQYDYYSTNSTDGMAGQLWKETVPGIGGGAQVTKYAYGYGEQGKWRTSPTSVIYKDENLNDKYSTTTYDEMDRVVKTTDGDGRSIWYAYDAQGRSTLTIYKFDDQDEDEQPDYSINTETGVVTSDELKVYTQSFYSCCNLLWSQDENGRKTYYDYDDLKRVTKTWTAIPDQSVDAPLVTYGYDSFGNQKTVTTCSGLDSQDEPINRTTTYTYDKLNRVTKIDYPDGIIASEEFGYDDSGRLQWKKGGPEGKYTVYRYDVHGRLAATYYDYATLPDPFPTTGGDVTYAYDGASSLKTEMHDSSGDSYYTYDTQGRLKTYTPPVGLDSGYYVDYNYNNAGQKTEIKITNGITTPYDVEYFYYANGWLKEVKNLGTNVATYTYDAVGNRTRQQNHNGTYTDYAYATGDPRYMMDSITHFRIDEPLVGPDPDNDTPLMAPIVYTRDDAGNPVSMTDSIGTWTYGYDANNRLTTAIPPNPVPEQPAGGPYEYDWVGNRVRPPRDPNPSSPSTANQMVYNKADRLVTWPGMHTYAYYGDGSLKEEKNAAGTQVVKSYIYTPDGLLDEADFGFSSPTQSRYMKNVWDANKNRVAYEVGTKAYGAPDTHSAESSHTFVYDTTAGSPAVIQEDGVYYLREPGGELIAMIDPVEGDRCYHFDQLGSTRLLSKANGAVTNKYVYDAYGALLAHEKLADSVDQPYQYVGRLGYYTHYQESTFGLAQLGVRFLDPEVGRFTQVDPEGDVHSRYLYVRSRPTRYLDPDGRRPRSPGLGPIPDVKPGNGWDWVFPDPVDKAISILCPSAAIVKKIVGKVENVLECQEFVHTWHRAVRDCERLYESKLSQNCWNNPAMDGTNRMGWVKACWQRRMSGWYTRDELKHLVESCGKCVKDIVGKLTGGYLY